MPEERPNVLVTGAGGTIGGILLEELSADFAVSGLDKARGRRVDRVADMTELGRVERAFEGMSAVVDLAADASMSASWSSVRENNIPATLNAFEAARRAGVSRVIFASSNHVTGMYEHDEPYASIVAGNYVGLDPATVPQLTTNLPVRPDGPYGVGKLFGEAAGRYYAEEHGLSVICLRIGTVSSDDRPATPRHFATLLSHRDLVHLVRCCLSAPASLRFGVYFGVSANTWRFWDLETGREELAYAPEDDAERWR